MSGFEILSIRCKTNKKIATTTNTVCPYPKIKTTSQNSFSNLPKKTYLRTQITKWTFYGKIRRC